MRDDQILDETIGLLRANSRTPHARSGDLRAQIAGNIVGERRLLELCERYGRDGFEEAVARALDESERAMRAALRSIGDGVFRASDYLEDRDGIPNIRIVLRLELRDGRALFDYDGTSAQVDAPLNAVFGVTLSGRSLRAASRARDPTIPMNEGCFRPIEVHVPVGTLLNPRRPAAVSGRKRGDEHAQRGCRAAGVGAGRTAASGSLQRRHDE